MALVVTIATVDRTSIVETDSIRINQVADSFTFTAELSLFDEDGDVTILAGSHNDAGAEAVRSDITVVDGATTYFGGYAVNQDIEAAEDGSRHLNLQCQGFGIKLNETLIEYEEYTNKADDWIINDLFDTYLAAFDSVTEVAQLDAGMDISFTEMTLAECMEAICARTKGRWYIDNDKNVHYFAAEENEVAWFLSDTPEAAVEQLVTNPIIHVDTTGWAAYGTNTIERIIGTKLVGDGALKCVYQDTLSLCKIPVTLAATTAYYMHCYIYVGATWDGGDIQLRPDADNGATTYVSQWLAATDPKSEWFLLETKFVSGADTSVGFRIRATGAPTAGRNITIDACQAELGTDKTSLCYGDRAGCEWQGDAHDSKSDRIISYSYHAKPEQKIDAAAIVNRIRVIGADNFAVTRNDGASQAIYDIRAAIDVDQSLETTAQMEEHGDAILDKNKDPRTTYVVETFQDGAIAGMDIGFRCPQLDIDTTQVIRELNITWWMNEPSYAFTLGTHAETSAISRAFYTGSTIRKIIIDPNIPMGSRGWGHDIPFVATDYRTVKWVDGGTITLAGGVGSFAIAANAGNSTGNMAATTYIYFDAGVSLTELQDDVDPANAIGANKILVAVAGPVADEDTNLAIFQVFGGAGTGVLIVADNIAADTISGNEIAANAIVAGHIEAAAIETDKIKAGAVVADKLAIGEMIFSNADGLLMLNPPIEIVKPDATSYWRTLRGQQATLSGALRFVPGRWQGTKAVAVEPATVNYTDDPILGKGDLTEWTLDANLTETRDTEHVRFGTHSMKLVPTGGDTDNWIYDTTNWVDDVEFANEDVTLSVYVWIPSGVSNTDVTLKVYEDVGGGMGLLDSKDAAAIYDKWQRVQITAVFAGLTDVRFQLNFDSDNVAHEIWADGFQLEKWPITTNLCHGDLGDGYAWDNGAHASTSTRTATVVNLDAHVALLEDNDTWSMGFWVQAPYDYDVPWPVANINRIVGIRGAADADRFYIGWDFDVDGWKVYLKGALRATVVDTFSAGDWIHVFYTADFGNDSYILYLDGVAVDTDTTALVALDGLADWCLGGTYNESAQSGWVFGGYTAFGRVVTAIEVAQIHNLQRPLIDTGATDTPGIYILDGKFRIQSSQTGVRIEITADQIAGYDSAGTKQFYLQASDGKAYAGEGAVVLDEDGINIAITDAEGTTRAYKFSISGANIGGLYGLASATAGVIRLSAIERVDKTSSIDIQALAPATYKAQTFIRAKSGATDVNLAVIADSDAGTPGFGTLTGATYFNFVSGYVSMGQIRAQVGADLEIRLADAAGGKHLEILDSSDQVQFRFTSTGRLYFEPGTQYLYRSGVDIYWYDGTTPIKLN